ncbi:hypothetical protein BDW22DRAFT_1462026 [Trametopsis cervina]|nr:hypothetical protein BDW22DRAFT_1462026 [Trametopsis cervina]
MVDSAEAPALPCIDWLERVKRPSASELEAGLQLRFHDGLVAAQQSDGKYVLTSPNAPFLPMPPYGRLSITMKSNGKFGQEDPIEWPQVYVPEQRYHFLACVPRYSHPRRRPEVWATPTFIDFQLHAPNLLQALYILSPNRLEPITALVEELEAEAAALTNLDTQQLRWLVISTRHALDRLTVPATQRDLIRQFVCVERNFCMTLAWITWHNLYANLPPAPHVAPVHRDLMGAFTTDPNIAQKLHHVGIPVWYMRLAANLGPADIIVKIVKVTPPTDIITSTGDYNGVVVYEGPPGIRQLEAVCYKGHLYADIEPVPYPADYAPAEDVIDHATAVAASTTTPHPRARDTPSAAGPSRASKSNAERPEPWRSKFEPIAHSCLPPSVAIWEVALRGANLKPSNVQRYVLNWLKIRDAWYYITRDARYRRPLPTRWWRVYLDEGPYPQTETGGKSKAKERSHVMKILALVFSTQNIRTGDIQPTWFGRPIADVDEQLCREVAWEISEMAFRTELLMLDLKFFQAHSDPALAAQRVEYMQQIFPGGRQLYLTSLPSANIGLASEDPLVRANSLEPLRRLMLAWPGVPDYIRFSQSLDTAGDSPQVRGMERAMAEFYTRTFYQQSGRAPVLPRRFPFAQ